MLMQGVALTFQKDVQITEDDFNDPVIARQDVVIEDCLIAPIVEPANAREQQAIDQSKLQVRIHLPKATSEDISNSNLIYDGEVFRVDNDSVVFMDENTPTRWNRYFRAEAIGQYLGDDEGETITIFTTEDGNYLFTDESEEFILGDEVN